MTPGTRVALLYASSLLVVTTGFTVLRPGNAPLALALALALFAWVFLNPNRMRTST